MNFRVGISSTFIEEAALQGVTTIIDTVRLNNGEVPFILSTREKDDNSVTDGILEQLEKENIPLICVSTQKYRKSKEKDWRQNWGREVLDKLKPYLPLDLVFLFGDMTIWPENMCRELTGLNLHPDLPGRFKGEWYEVIAQIVRNKSEEAGVKIHLVSPELDQGPVLTYCRFSLRGSRFDSLWESLPKPSGELEELIRQQKQFKENPSHPLWREIRRQGLAREFPLIEKALAVFAEEKIRVVKEGTGWKVIDGEGKRLTEGYDLSKEVEEVVHLSKEGQFPSRKEAKN